MAAHLPLHCRFCDGVARSEIRSFDFNRKVSTERFTYYRCAGCRSLLLEPIPGDLDRYYPREYYNFPATEQALAAKSEHETYKLDLVTRFAATGRLLEIGPGEGGFAFLAKRAGFDVVTVEMDAGSSEFLRTVAHVEVVNTADPVTAMQGTDRFDVIALWHVIEHLPAPAQTIRAAAAALAPGGIIIVAAPNPGSIQFKLFRSRWAHLDAPRHLQLIPVEAVRECAESWGLESLLETTTDIGGLGWNSFGWQMSLRNLVPALARASLPGRVLCRLARPLERRGMNGSAYTLVLRKVAKG